jgi:hypothetical protein
MTNLIEAKHSLMVYDDDGKSVAVLYDKQDDQWGNPRAVDRDSFNKILPAECTAEVYAFYDNRMLWFDQDRIMIWYSPPSKRKITISERDPQKSKQQRWYCHPGIVFMVKRKNNQDTLNIAIYSTSGDERPNLYQNIYEIPYRGIDVHPRGGVMGHCSVNRPNPEFAFSLDVMAHWEWEACFYNSKFNYMPTPRNKIKQQEVTLHEWIRAHHDQDD